MERDAEALECYVGRDHQRLKEIVDELLSMVFEEEWKSEAERLRLSVMLDRATWLRDMLSSQVNERPDVSQSLSVLAENILGRTDIFHQDDVPHDLAEKLVAESAWWLTHHPEPCRAPGHAEHLYKDQDGWMVDFGANSFAPGRAISMAKNYAHDLLSQAMEGTLPSPDDIRGAFRRIVRRCVRNVNGSFYDLYPVDSRGDMVFGATSIDTNDCEEILLEMTGIGELLDQVEEEVEAA